MKRLTGTHVYSYVKCPRLAALDLHRDRAERRPPHAWEEFAARRGRDYEAVFVAGLEAIEPRYPARDFAAGSEATLQLLREGVGWIYQAVLQHGDRLGLPDLLRRLPGASALGDHHYEVVDVKTSGRARGDQILQVVFYSRLLEAVQGRLPEHGALVLKDGREERFAIADYLAVADDVMAELQRLQLDPSPARPFLQPGCDSCHWNHHCLPELETRGDLSLVQGMTPGARTILESLGCRTVQDLATFQPEGARARGNLDATLLRRLRRAAQVKLSGALLPEVRPKNRPLDPAAIIHLLTDPYADRVLLFALLSPATADGVVRCVAPQDRDGEWPAFRSLIADLPREAHLLHFGAALPHWYERQANTREAEIGVSARFLDFSRRLRHAAVFPGPVPTLADLVRHGLGRDPYRHGHHGAAAMWLDEPDAEARLVQKARADLDDLLALKLRLLDGVTGERSEPCS